MGRFAPLDGSQPILKEDGTMTSRTQIWNEKVSRLAITRGTGSPEGVIAAQEDALYIDSTGIAGAVLFIKRDADILGDRTKGWISVG